MHTLIQVFILSLFVFTTNCIAVEQCRQSVKLGLVADWPPLTYFRHDEAQGLDIEIAKMVFNSIDICVNYVRLPSSARALEQMEKGYIDVAVMVSYTEERAKYGYFSRPYRNEKMRLFSYLEPQPISSLNELLDEGKTIGLSIGSFYGQELIQLANSKRYQNQLVQISSAERRAEMLVKKRVDFIVDDLITGLYMMKSKGYEKIKPWPYVVHDNQVHFFIRKSQASKKILDSVNNAIESLQPKIDLLVASFVHRQLTHINSSLSLDVSLR
ncbi:transporter substrate-binding domain-containing protein [Pseudoalteromonas sp. JBTF-M23]|uniref:Transporter substrate-binding domain-containing protein n=1 Tax=Pseudoalteromonas caenipelagi TaxID=2726988 RepID=A0A849V7W5_9GAMM|nr:transporter substrate-binding domain-containing protein [Pseudoalteromonas caenipelagi]NOU49316.1 transporter substrate-binding domain-containing protein [Pseudoalteromonas caenipelagi]